MSGRIVEIDGKKIRYDWEYGRVTLTWRNKLDDWKMATGIVRIHDDAANVPGDYHSSVTVIVEDGIFELEAFIGPKPYGPVGHEFKAFYSYLEDLGLKKLGHVRVKTGKKPRVVKPHKKSVVTSL